MRAVSVESHQQQESTRLPPPDESLPLGFDFASTVEREGLRLLALVASALDASGKRGDDFAADLGLDPAQLSRALNGRGAHFSLRWLPAVLWRDREHRVITALCRLAGGEFVAKPKRQRADVNEDVRRAVEEQFGEAGRALVKRIEEGE